MAIRSASFAARLPSKSASTTEAPHWANMRAVAKPMPLAAPVTNATCPSKLYIGFICTFTSCCNDLASSPGRKISFDAFNEDGERTGPIKYRNVIGYSPEQDNPWLRDTAVA